MNEIIPESSLFDDLTGNAVDLLAGRAWSGKFAGGAVGLIHRIIHRAHLPSRLASAKSAGNIGWIILKTGAKVNQQKLIFTPDALASVAMWQAALLAGQNQHKGQSLRPSLQHFSREPVGDLTFRQARPRPLHRRLQRGLADVNRLLHQSDFLRRFPRPKLQKQLAGIDPVRRRNTCVFKGQPFKQAHSLAVHRQLPVSQPQIPRRLPKSRLIAARIRPDKTPRLKLWTPLQLGDL